MKSRASARTNSISTTTCLYEIHVATGADVAAGTPTFTYQFRFTTSFKNQDTILQSFLGVIQNVDDANQNLTQTYTVTKVNRKTNATTVLGTGVVPPNNQGIATPRYERRRQRRERRHVRAFPSGRGPRCSTPAQTIKSLSSGYRSFAGQREDGFYADVQAIFDLLQFRSWDNHVRQPGRF